MTLSDMFSTPDSTPTGPYSNLSSASSQFPPVYTLADATADIAAGFAALGGHGDSRYILGVNGEGEPLYIDLSGDSPHVLVSAATGGGKSSILRSVAAQALAQGDQVVILDIKQHSQSWAEGLPNVFIANTLSEIGNALVQVGQEVHARNAFAKEWLSAQRAAGNWDVSVTDAPVGKRTVVLFEEMNATFTDLKELTRATFRNTNTYDAWNGLKDTVLMGRAAHVHIVAVGQYMGARAMGGGEILVNFGTRILISHDVNTWHKLAWDCGFPKAAPEEQGRGYVCSNGKAKMIQLLFMTEREAREYVKKHSPRALTAAHSPSPTYPNLPARQAGF